MRHGEEMRNQNHLAVIDSTLVAGRLFGGIFATEGSHFRECLNLAALSSAVRICRSKVFNQVTVNRLARSLLNAEEDITPLARSLISRSLPIECGCKQQCAGTRLQNQQQEELMRYRSELALRIPDGGQKWSLHAGSLDRVS